MASYPPPNSDFFSGANYNNAFFTQNTSGISYAYATNQYLARVGNPNSTALTTSFSGTLNTVDIIPTSTNTADLGSTSKYFDNAFINNLYTNNEIVAITETNVSPFYLVNSDANSSQNAGFLVGARRTSTYGTITFLECTTVNILKVYSGSPPVGSTVYLSDITNPSFVQFNGLPSAITLVTGGFTMALTTGLFSKTASVGYWSEMTFDSLIFDSAGDLNVGSSTALRPTVSTTPPKTAGINCKNVVTTGFITAGGAIKTNNNTASTSPTTGSFHCDGGAGIVGDCYIGGICYPLGGIVIGSTTSPIYTNSDITTAVAGRITSAGLFTSSGGISNTGTIVSTGAITAPPTYAQNSQTFNAGWWIQYSTATLASYTQLNVPISAGGATTTTPIGVSITPTSLTPIIMLNFSLPLYTDVGGQISLTIYRSTVSLLGTSTIVNSNLSIIIGTNGTATALTFNVPYIDTPTITAGQTLYYTLWAKTVGGTASRVTIQSTANIAGFINSTAYQLN